VNQIGATLLLLLGSDRGYFGTDLEIWIKNQEASRLPLDKDIDLSTELISDLAWCIIQCFQLLFEIFTFYTGCTGAYQIPSTLIAPSEGC
jgi:hypothetical protein